MIRLLFACALALAAPAAFAQAPQAASEFWTQSNGRIIFETARISLPVEAGPVRLRGASEFSHQGQGIDSGLQYRTPDDQVFGTVYVYYPGLSHSGLTALATDHVIRTHGGSRLRALGSRTVAAAGRDNIALRHDYAGYRGNLASSAAFLKAGRWIIKIRVSGPDARRAEVEAAMAALLDGLRFEGPIQPRAAAPFEVGECTEPADRAARPLQVDEALVGARAMLGLIDGAGEEAQDERGNRLDPMLARVGARWCRSSIARIGAASHPILRALPGGEDGLGGRTVLLVPVTDSGTTLEMVESRDPHHFTILHHQVGRTVVLGTYDGVLSDEQVAAILSGSDREGGRIRATVRYLPNGDTNTELQLTPEPRPAPPEA